MGHVCDEVAPDRIDATFLGNGVDHRESAAHRCLVAALESSLGPLRRLCFRRPTVDDVADPLADVLGVVADALVEPADKRQLQRLLRIECSTTGVLDDVLDVAVVKVVEKIVEFVDRLRKLSVSSSECMAGPTEEFGGLRRHANNEVAHLVIGMRTLEPTDSLRDIGEQVTAALDIRVRVKRADNKPQICCDNGLFAHKRVDATLFDLGREQIDLVVTGDKLISECDVALEHRCRDLGDPIGHHLDHLKQVAFDQGDALVELATVLHQPNRPVT